MSTQIAHRRFEAVRHTLNVVLLWLLLLTTLALLSPRPAAAVQRQCGAAPLPACPGPPPMTTAWEWTVYNNMGAIGPPANSVHSDQEVFAFFDGYIHTTYSSRICGDSTVRSIITPSPMEPTPRVLFGITYGKTHRLLIDYFVKDSATLPCGKFTVTVDVLMLRDFVCHDPTTLFYQSNPVVGPYCAQPSSPSLQFSPGKTSGECCVNPNGSQNSGGADSGSSRIFKANPVDVLNGNKFQSEVDYEGSALSQLRFTRSYNSRAAHESSLTSSGTTKYGRKPLGNGWAATYFQSLDITTVTDSNGTHSAVYAHRPDGRQLIFNLYNGVYNPDADVADNLIATSTGFRYITAAEVWETYDLEGRLLSISKRGQFPVTLNYSDAVAGGSIYPVSVSGPFGHTLTLSYAVRPSGAVRLNSVSDPAGSIISYTYGSTDNLSSVIYQDLTSRIYSYAFSDGRGLTGITDEASVLYSSWTYNSDGSSVLSAQRAGGVERYEFSGSGSSRTVKDPLNTSRIYGGQLSWYVNRVTTSNLLCSGCQEDKARAYDANGNIASRTDYNDIQTIYSYDTNRNLEQSRTKAFGTAVARTTNTQWNTDFRLPSVISEPNRTTTFTHDSNGNILTRTITDTSATPSASRTWTYTYNTLGQMLTADGPRSDVSDLTTYTYYACNTGYQCGQLQTMSNAAGQVTSFDSYDAHGQPLTISDPNDVVTTLAYDTRQRLTSRTTAGELTTFEYWPTGLLKKVTQPDGSFVLYNYDDAHRLYKVEDGLGNRIQYTLDAMGNHKAENIYDPSGLLSRARRQDFNSLNQLWKQIGAADTAAVTTTFGYDNNGNQTTTNAPLGRNSVNAYDELNRLKQITDPGNGVTQFGYDANDNLTSVTDPRNLVTSYVYNGFGDLKSQTSPDTGVTSTTYDAAGNLQTSTDARGVVTTYIYDELNRVKSTAFKLGTTTDQTISFTYDERANGKGHLTGASDADHALAWNFDALGRVTGKGQTVGSVTKSIGYGYSNGQLSTITLPSGQLVTYEYNSNNQVTGVRVGSATVLSNVLYDPFGPVTGWTWGNGTLMSRTYDQDGKLEQFDSAGLKTYSYDDAFRISGIADQEAAANSWNYGYDLLDRITSANKTGTVLGWTYDANGNRLTQSGSSASTFTISNMSNRISSTSGALARAYAYDSAGNTTSYTEATATYNNRGRLKTLTKAGVTATYAYNALGQLLKQSGGLSGTVLYHYDEAGHLIGEYSSTGALIQETVWLGDIPVATLRPNGASVSIYYVHTDHLNTPIRITRPSDNALMWTWYTNPFGTEIANENPAGAGAFKYNLRFAGQLYDPHSGLHYNYFRDYDPSAGRYMQSDPIGLGGGINTYAYVEGNPVAHSDSSGLLTCDGRWRRMGEVIPTYGAKGWTTLPSGSCKCFWLCMPCSGQAMYGDIYSLPSTWGRTVILFGDKANPGSGGIRPTPTGPSGGPSATAGGSASCICRKPSFEIGCTQCYPHSPYQ